MFYSSIDARYFFTCAGVNLLKAEVNPQFGHRSLAVKTYLEQLKHQRIDEFWYFFSILLYLVLGRSRVTLDYLLFS